MYKEDWNKAIYRIIEEASGTTISLNEIYQAIKNHPLVSPYHLHPWKLGGQPRYQCWIRRCLTNLIHEKRIKRVARALYSIY